MEQSKRHDISKGDWIGFRLHQAKYIRLSSNDGWQKIPSNLFSDMVIVSEVKSFVRKVLQVDGTGVTVIHKAKKIHLRNGSYTKLYF